MDTWVTKCIEEKIRLCGAETFLDQTRLAVGDDFEKVILKELERADEILALLTPWAMTRPYVWSELGHALKRHIRIVGVLYGVKPEDPSLPQFMRRRLLVDINNIDEYLAQLQVRVGYHEKK